MVGFPWRAGRTGARAQMGAAPGRDDLGGAAPSHDTRACEHGSRVSVDEQDGVGRGQRRRRGRCGARQESERCQWPHRARQLGGCAALCAMSRTKSRSAHGAPARCARMHCCAGLGIRICPSASHGRPQASASAGQSINQSGRRRLLYFSYAAWFYSRHSCIRLAMRSPA